MGRRREPLGTYGEPAGRGAASEGMGGEGRNRLQRWRPTAASSRPPTPRRAGCSSGPTPPPFLRIAPSVLIAAAARR
jgi:hypothetical protein